MNFAHLLDSARTVPGTVEVALPQIAMVSLTGLTASATYTSSGLLAPMNQGEP
jgi:hypothetical protein